MVDATVAVIAEVGLENASFAKIAKHAGLSSTSLISYHFAGRSDLIATVATRVRTAFADYVMARLDESSPMRTLLSFCAASVDFIGERPTYMVALRQILAAAPSGKGASGLASDDRERLAALFVDGQRCGDFREFDPATMASFVLALRDDVIGRSIAEPGLDINLCRNEMVAAVERATRKDHR
ncbi:TetR/AcrR family transcriptional regulator [Dactylosporangium sp. CA-233914]|uniref:TetR/AcrR family transcriptional regulator n=1 Tax=Dactylosporangium sp. CA-233914 TaxID=3239934 RepID=UPI003D8F04FB